MRLWGIKYQHEIIDDRMNEWQRIDSAAFSIPYNPGIPGQPGNLTDFVLNYHLQTSATVLTQTGILLLHKIHGLWMEIQPTLAFTAGVRFQLLGL